MYSRSYPPAARTGVPEAQKKPQREARPNGPRAPAPQIGRKRCLCAFQQAAGQDGGRPCAPDAAHSPFSGLKKLKKESLGTCLVTVLTVPRPLCFCFFLIVLTVTFFPFFQSMTHLRRQTAAAHVCTCRGGPAKCGYVPRRHQSVRAAHPPAPCPSPSRGQRRPVCHRPGSASP